MGPPLEALARDFVILGNSDSWRHFIPHLQSYCLKSGVIPRVALGTPNNDSIPGLVAARMGVTLYPDCELNHTRGDIAIHPLENSDARLSIELAWHLDNSNPAVTPFIEQSG
ncbi:LysR substrate-binding domain-containing protein [Halomonas halocynthiae]|uniref:LysR substrate-binding domain-containing protein n=1 Tax=Halomonas halocynthiae TaxID=176290 RepID=UPI000A0561A0|nr:LysR substrate-binding domain-containing protein [Halomonas halocynthiae]